jgi:replicative DNA helicase
MTAGVIPDFSPAEDILLSEEAVAGAAMASAGTAAVLGDIVRPEHFRKASYGLIFGAAQALAERGDPVDPIAVMAELTRGGDLARAGGGPALHGCLAAGAAVPSPGWHADRVAADFQRRDTAAALTTSLGLVTSPQFDPATGFEHIRKLVDDAVTPPRDTGLRPMSTLVTDVIDALEHEAARGLPTGFADLDEGITGLAPGELVLVAARPSVGKSIITTQIAAHVSVDLGFPVLLSSLEMSAEEITLRLIAAEARVNLTSLLRRQVAESDWPRIGNAASRIGDSPLAIDDTPGASLAHIRSRLRGMARTEPARLLVVDYLGLLTGPKAENRQVAVSELSRGLKLIAREFAIPVLAAAQLNRGPEQRSDKRPMLSDLRESGAQEQDADVVILLHREDAYVRESPRAGEIDFDIAKNRQGPQFTITAAFQGHYARCMDMAPPTWSPSSALGDAA